MSYNQCSNEPLAHIKQLLDSNEYEKAVLYIQKQGANNPEMKNALGVCLMRLGRVEYALEVLRDLVFQKFISIPRDTPPLYQANYATALLLKRYNLMAIEIIQNLPVSSHPYIEELRLCLDQWRFQLPLYRRILCSVKIFPSSAVELTMPPGSL